MIVLPALLGEKDAASYLGVSASTLRGLGIKRRVLGAALWAALWAALAYAAFGATITVTQDGTTLCSYQIASRYTAPAEAPMPKPRGGT